MTKDGTGAKSKSRKKKPQTKVSKEKVVEPKKASSDIEELVEEKPKNS